MADDSNSVGEASSSAAALSSQTASQVDDRSQILAQATRFLTSANISESASDDDKREFLRSKGLSEDEITRAFQDAKSPVEGLHARHATTQQSEAGDVDPFELAARQFDDPINADAIAPPPKSYPNSPLALYYDPPASQPGQGQHGNQQLQGGQPASPLTRYQVLLQFFRTLSYMMMLGGGLTAILVSAYRAYILPKITAMFDARSIVLKHHIVLFDKLRSNVASLATYVPVQQARIGSDDTAASSAASPLKGVLKKVHFHDELAASAENEKEGVKSTQHGSDKSSTEKVVMPGTDVVVDAKTPLLSETREGSETDASVDGEDAESVAPKLEPIDIMTPIRESMARLAEALKGDLSGRPLASTSTSFASSTPRAARVASVTDAESGSDEWEDDDDDDADGSDDDDGLEFDPYGAYQKKHKHTQSSSSSSASTAKSGSGSASISGLKSALVSLNADISTHAFAANSSSSSMYSGGAFRFGPGTTDANASSGSGAESPKSGDLGQVKAEIRSLKGLLLSRRNFPSYGARPPPLPSANPDTRTSSAVV
ncbi:uncharacterized protein UTRI_00852_B [Ustilago trichophora]|uniref:Peroxisomal membrane protein PEX14 n=1 Tax=Ustilago trichophora TaxID=86804 RepID=A0A5C3DQP1_9BASI|nr:uncharacterized protein UTRI_00852_B [Ustilago trichophora]